MQDQKPEFPLTYMIDYLNVEKNKLPEVSNTKAKDPDFWKKYWETNSIRWHSPEVSPWLKRLCLKHLKKGQKLSVYFPLCGKSIDMLWMYQEYGYKIIGSDCSGICCEDFFIENKIPGYKK